MRNYSYKKPNGARVTVNPVGEVNLKTGEGVGGYAYSVCSYNFDLSRGDMRDGVGIADLQPTVGNTPSKPLKVYFYKRFNPSSGACDDRIMTYCADGYIYERSVSGGSLSKVAGLHFNSAPAGECYNFNGEDVIIFSCKSGGMLIYNGLSVTAAPTAPTVSSMCVHGERLFLTDGAENNSLWFSDDFDPTNWNISLSEAGFIDMSGFRGRLLKVISFGGYLYVFRSYGITRVTAYGDQNGFSVSDLYVSSGKIYENSVTVCGDCVLFFASDGLYRFDGLSAKRISDPYRDFIDFSFDAVKGVYFNGRAYFIMRMKFEDENAVCLLRLDPKNYADYYFVRGAEISDMVVIGGENSYKLCLLSSDGRLSELADTATAYGVPLTKAWLGKLGDFGLPAKRKLLEKLSLYSDGDINVVVTADDRKYAYAVAGKPCKSELRPLVTGDRFSVKITSKELNAKVVGLTLAFRYYDE